MKLIIIILIKLKKSQNIFKNKYLKKLNENSDIYFPSYNNKEDIKDKINMSLDDVFDLFIKDLNENDNINEK